MIAICRIIYEAALFFQNQAVLVQSFPIGLEKMSGLRIITNGLRQPVPIYEKEKQDRNYCPRL